MLFPQLTSSAHFHSHSYFNLVIVPFYGDDHCDDPERRLADRLNRTLLQIAVFVLAKFMDIFHQ